MDAYDIFKRITKGCIFIRRNKSTIESKENVTPQEIDRQPEHQNDHQNDQNNSITLLSDLVDVDAAKGKKRKTCMDENEMKKKKRLLEQEEINRYRNLNNISVVGTQIPNPGRSFNEFKIDPNLIENLYKCGYTTPTVVQQQAVPIMLQERELFACAPTGSGKTAAFLLPIIQKLKSPKKIGFRALILCPTRELANQTQRECIKLSEGKGLRVHIINKIKKALTTQQSGNKKYDILITTPNRLCFMLKQEPPVINLSNVQQLIIDEADKLFEDGARSFRKQLMEILHACNNKKRKISMFSATLTPIVAKWCKRNMPSAIKLYVGHKNAATETVDQQLLFVGTEQGKLLAFRDLIINGSVQPPVLIFVQSKDRAQQLFHELIYDGINVDAIHSDRTQTQRENTVRAFREGKIWILICTELMARGIDFKGVNLVINYDFPPSSISYVHRIGRAGRAGRRGKAITFFTTEDKTNLRSIAHKLIEAGCEVPKYMLTLKKQHKSEIKKLTKKAPNRDEITTTLLYDRIKGGKM